MDWNFEVVDQLESHWRQRLRPRWNGLTDDEYFWAPVPGCWTIRPGEDGRYAMDQAWPPPDPEPVTTIAWRLAHLLDVFGPPTAPHFEPTAPHFEPADRAGTSYPTTADEALRRIDEAHDAWIHDVRNLGAEGLTRPQGALSPPAFADAPIARLVMYTHVEVFHHGAEISLLRDLYAWKA